MYRNLKFLFHNRATAAALAAAAIITPSMLLAPPAAADPRQVVVEEAQPTISCDAVTSDGSLVQLQLVVSADGEFIENYLEVIEEGWGEDLAEGVPVSTTFAGGVVEAVFELVAPGGASVGTARFAGTFTVGETVTTREHWAQANTQWHSLQSYTPYALTWTSFDVGPWQVAETECTAFASEGRTSYTVPHRGVVSGAVWDIDSCVSGEVTFLDVVTNGDEQTFLLVETATAQAVVAASGADGSQTGTVRWYDLEGEELGEGAASVSWQQLSPRKVNSSFPSKDSNRVTHATSYRLTFELERPAGPALAHGCDVALVEWRQIGGIEE